MLPTSTSAMISALDDGSLTSEALTQACLDRISENDRVTGAFLAVHGEEALERARTIDRDRAAGKTMGPLAGIPVAIKDNIHVAGWKTTCASRALEHFTSPFDATVTQRLRDAGMVFLGKTNMDEFAMGSSTEHSAVKITRNPHHPEHVPGGSSGGSAAAVAAGMVPFALGSDTGGSIRQPASFCGVTGLKPTYGRVSRYGLVAFGSSLDQIGPFSQDVTGAAYLYQVMAGHDPRDSTAADKTVEDVTTGLEEPPEGLRVGVLPDEALEGARDDVRATYERARDILKAEGATIVPCDMPHAKYAIPTYYLLATAEASANLARYDGVRYGHRSADGRNLAEMYTRTRSEGFGNEVKRRIMLGTYCLSSGYYEGYYLNARKVRALIAADYHEIFAACDVLLHPTCPTAAFRLGERLDDPIAMYLSDVFTVTANLAGVPAISLPAGKDTRDLPIGMQLTAARFEEPLLLRSAFLMERYLAAKTTK